MADPSARDGRLPIGVTRLPQPETNREIREWRPTAIGFNILTDGKGINAIEKRRETLKDVRNGHLKHTTLSVRMEMAASILACGGTFRQAARAIGASPSTVRSYMARERFRERVGELQSLVAQGVSGRILTEFERRTRPEAIAKLEVLDLTRIMDRVQDRTPAAIQAKQKEEGVDEDEKYNVILQQINITNSGHQGEDFPSYSAEELRLSDGDPQG